MTHESEGTFPVVFNTNGDEQLPTEVNFVRTDTTLEVDVSKVKDVWDEGMKDDILDAVDRYFGRLFFLSHNDLTLEINGL